MALFAFRKKYEGLFTRNLDADFGTELDLIAGTHFRDLLEDYSDTRQLCTGDVAISADETLRSAALRLTARLAEIAAQQNRRNVSSLSTTGNYIRGRHPVDGDDPFG